MKYYPVMCTRNYHEIFWFLGFNGNKVFELFFFFFSGQQTLRCYNATCTNWWWLTVRSWFIFHQGRATSRWRWGEIGPSKRVVPGESSWEPKGTPTMPPARKPIIHSPLIRPYSLGGLAFGGPPEVPIMIWGVKHPLLPVNSVVIKQRFCWKTRNRVFFGILTCYYSFIFLAGSYHK